MSAAADFVFVGKLVKSIDKVFAFGTAGAEDSSAVFLQPLIAIKHIAIKQTTL